MTVFAVLAHGDPGTFNVVSESLTNHAVVVHVDASSDTSKYVRRPNIHYVRDRVNVRWGGFSVVEATLRLYEEALRHASHDGEFVVLLSGQCVPLKPIRALDRFLLEHSGYQFCRAGLLLDGERRNEERVLRRWEFDRFDARPTRGSRRLNAAMRRTVRAISPKLRQSELSQLNVVAGSQWTALTSACLSSVLQDHLLVSKSKAVFQNALAPDEIFFHTLVHSSEWGRQTLTPLPSGKGNRRTADFANLHHIDHSLTKFMTSEDLRGLVRSEAFFARKVSVAQDPSIADTIRELFGAGTRSVA